MASNNPDLYLADSWRQFESLLLKQLPPQIPAPSPVSPSPFSFLSPLRLDDTISHLPAADYHLYGTHPMCRSSDLVLCSECGQPVPPFSLSRHFDNSHSTPPSSPGVEVLELLKPPVCLPLQPSYKLNSNPPERHKINKKKSSRPKDRAPLSPAAPLSPPVPLSALKQESVLRPAKRFPSFLADSSQSLKSAKMDLQTKNASFSFYSPSLPPALPFRHLPALPGPLVFSPASSSPRLTPSGLLLTSRSADRMHFALSQVFSDSAV